MVPIKVGVIVNVMELVDPASVALPPGGGAWVRLYKLNPVVTRSLKAPGFQPLNLESEKLVSKRAIKSSLYRYTWGGGGGDADEKTARAMRVSMGTGGGGGGGGEKEFITKMLSDAAGAFALECVVGAVDISLIKFTHSLKAPGFNP
jgi:hypothetical protein